MDEITVSAKTLDDAITEALIQLGVTSDRLDYDVIEKGSSGFLGIGIKQAVIRARRKKEEKPVEEPIPEPKEKTAGEEKPIKEVKPAKEVKSVREVKPVKEVKSVREVKPVKESKPVRAAKPVWEEKPVKKVKQESEVKSDVELAKVESKTIEACEKFLIDVLKTMDMEVEITSEIDKEGALSINLEGKNMGILIGKRGQTLDSLQYLTNRVANKMQDGYVRVKLDTEDYRRRRKETLENLAKNIAHKVKRTRKTVSLEPMNPYERRIIHSVLQSDKAVSTHSEGEEPYRHVVITLNRRSYN